MLKSESIKEIATALAKAQSEISNPKFDSENPHFKNKFASLASVRNAVIPAFAKNGLSVMQHITSTESSVKCGVVITHSSGEWIEFEPLDIPVSKADAQGFMSAATYAKRGTLQAVACIVGDDDDDGNAAAKAKPEKQVIKEIVQKTTAPNFGAEMKLMAECGSLNALAQVWGKFDKLTQHALASAKEEYKLAIIKAETSADVPQ